MSSSIEDDSTTHHDPADTSAYVAVQESDQFQMLRRKHRSIVFPLTAVFLGWYLLYVLLADYAHGFMNQKIAGNITVGLVMGLLQFVSTFVIATVYVRFANKNLDPVAENVRNEVERSAP